MPKSDTLQKYGAPLYAIEWFNSIGYMCGGGNMGIENKCVFVGSCPVYKSSRTDTVFSTANGSAFTILMSPFFKFFVAELSWFSVLEIQN